MPTARYEHLRDARQCTACGQRFSRDAAFCPFDGLPLAPASFDPLADPLLGTTIDGRYEPVEVIGEGGMGRVYRVRHVSLDRTFAMKILRRELATDDELATRFVREAKATAAIKHPNIVQITDFGLLAGGIPYFVMELLVGRTLRDFLRNGPVPKDHALSILRQLASGLDAAHEAGVIHRDLKPENVFLTDSTQAVRKQESAGWDCAPGGQGIVSEGASRGSAACVRLVDFGASRVVGASRMTREGIVFGTPYYMSPEQAAGQEVDCRADVYSLGVIMYETLTGRRPFEGASYMGVLAAHLFDPPVPPSQVNPVTGDLGALDGITLRCLAKAPENRFASMRELLRELERASAPDSVGARGRAGAAPPIDRLVAASDGRSRTAAADPRRGLLLMPFTRTRRVASAVRIALAMGIVTILGAALAIALGAPARRTGLGLSTAHGQAPETATSAPAAPARPEVDAREPRRPAQPSPAVPGSPSAELRPQASPGVAPPLPTSLSPAPWSTTGAPMAPASAVSQVPVATASGKAVRRPVESTAQQKRPSGRVLDDIGDPFAGRP